MRQIRYSLLSVLILLSACATASSVESAPLNAGKSRLFEAEYDATRQAAREAMVETGLQIKTVTELDANTWTLLGEKGASAFSWGELVRVAVIREGPAQTRVTVHTERRVATNITAKSDYADAILSHITLKFRG